MPGRYRIGVVSDTHGYFHPRLPELLCGVDLILHAGDIGRESILDRLRELAPVHAIVGNVDPLPTPEIPERLELETPIARIAMAHGHLPDAPTMDRRRMLGCFSAFRPDILVYGHSHIALLELIDGVRVFNPGAAGRARFGLRPSIGLISGTPGSGETAAADLVLEHVDLESGPSRPA